MKIIPFFISILVITSSPLCSQSSLDTVLAVVVRNNPGLRAVRQFWEAENLRNQIGLSLPNPTIQGEYLFGSPETAGNQIDFSALQAFDLPVAYRKRRELAQTRSGVSAPEIASLRQELILQTKLTCLELVYRNKLTEHYERRQTDLDQLRNDFQNKLQRGEGNILDVNKISLQLLELQQSATENQLQFRALQTRLDALNGGEEIAFRDSIYPALPEILDFEQVERIHAAKDPQRQLYNQRKRIAEKELEVSQLYRLPSFAAGYRYQGILGQRFNGIHAGVTLPLWEHKNRTQAQQERILHVGLQFDQYLNTNHYELRKLYDRQAALSQYLEEYGLAFSRADNTALLNKALQFGEITTLEYFLETSLYHNAILHFLQFEYEYYATIAKLTRYQL